MHDWGWGHVLRCALHDRGAGTDHRLDFAPSPSGLVVAMAVHPYDPREILVERLAKREIQREEYATATADKALVL